MTSPIKYNRQKIKSGFFTDEHIKWLVQHYQEEDEDLVDDGCFGGLTRAALEAEFKEDQFIPEPSPLALMSLSVALEELGKGEEHRDNAGEAVHRYRDFPYGDDFARPCGNWCAFLIGHCVEEAASRLGVPTPFRRRFYDKRFNRKMPIGSALRQAKRIGNAGEFIVKDGKWKGTPIPGDVFSTKRGNNGYGHTGIIMEPISRTEAKTVEGNVGKFPSVVKVLHRDFEHMALVDIVRL